jgi:hypothetical protein
MYSPKILEMIDHIKNPEHDGSHLLYSNFRTLGGISIMQLALEEHGFEITSQKLEPNGTKLKIKIK